MGLWTITSKYYRIFYPAPPIACNLYGLPSVISQVIIPCPINVSYSKTKGIRSPSNLASALRMAIMSLSVELSMITPSLRYICMTIHSLNCLDPSRNISKWLSVITPAAVLIRFSIVMAALGTSYSSLKRLLISGLIWEMTSSALGILSLSFSLSFSSLCTLGLEYGFELSPFPFPLSKKLALTLKLGVSSQVLLHLEHLNLILS